MNLRSLFNTALYLIIAGGMWAGTFLPVIATAEEPEIKGPNVVKVTYKGPARVQTFTQTGPALWTSARLVYNEVERDEWSVYLVRGKLADDRVAIDLHTRLITFYGKRDEVSYPLIKAWSRASK